MERENIVDNKSPIADYDPLFVRNMIESTLRIGLLALLLTVSYQIIRPFTVPILWGAIIAIAAFPLVKWLEPKLGGRRGLSASLVTSQLSAYSGHTSVVSHRGNRGRYQTHLRCAGTR